MSIKKRKWYQVQAIVKESMEEALKRIIPVVPLAAEIGVVEARDEIQSFEQDARKIISQGWDT